MTIDIQVNNKIAEYFQQRQREGKNSFCLSGGRRSGKTYFCCQILLSEALMGKIVNVATMTAEQGRLGAYADTKNIIASNGLTQYFDVYSSPREIRSKVSKGVIFFNSYQNSETAKGIACDWLFMNEANNFTEQQFVDLMANVREGFFLDFNPMLEFSNWWVSDYFTPEEVCNTTWRDNVEFLTPLQLNYFENLKRLGEDPSANPVHRRNYLIYYCGQYSEISGDIFTRDNIHVVDRIEEDVDNFVIFCDPSALRGADYFASVFACKGKTTGDIYIIDVLSVNTGSRASVVRHLREWLISRDNVRIFIETNGLVGIDFFEFCQNSELPVEGWTSKNNKFERILANFQNITERVHFLQSSNLDDYLKQVFDFSKKCEHDDNIDAISSVVDLFDFLI